MNPAATMMARPSSSPTRNCRFLGIGEKPSRSIYRYFTSNAAGGPVRNSETGRPRTQLLLEPAARGERLRAKPPRQPFKGDPPGALAPPGVMLVPMRAQAWTGGEQILDALRVFHATSLP